MSIGEFCTRQVAILTQQESILEAAKVMRAQHVGDVVIVEQRDQQTVPLGILTDRDIIIEVIAKQISLDSVTAGDIMSPNLLTVRQSDTVADAIRKMRNKGVRRIPVVNDQGGLEGIFSLDDLLELLAEQLNDSVAIVHKETDKEQEQRL